MASGSMSSISMASGSALGLKNLLGLGVFNE
jgi:hypothetical protein